MLTDPIADMLTRIRNASRARHEYVDVPASKQKLAIAKILKDEGFIRNYEEMPDPPRQGIIRIYLKYTRGRRSVITNIKRVSKPGLRIYAKRNNLPRVQRGFGIAILTTSKGIMTDKQAREEGVGGEVICYVW